MKPSKKSSGPDTPKPKSRTRTLSYSEAIDYAASLLREGKLQQAERLCLDIRKAQADDFNAALLLGILRSRQGDLNAALVCFDQALAAKPASYEALYNRAFTLQALQRHSEALAGYDAVLAVKPDCAESLTNRGISLQVLQRHGEGLASYDRALTVKPDSVEALNNRGNTLQSLRRYDEAITSYDKALDLQPNHAELLNHRGVTLHAMQRYSEALDNYQQALSLKRDYTEALSNRGVTLHALQRHREAMESYDRALAIKPDYADAVWNKSLLLLAMGEAARGWLLYEWRWKRSDAPPEAVFTEPLWLGHEDINGKRILLHAEQGLGDAIQFVRYASAVAAQGATVVLRVAEPLKTLLRNVAGVSRVISLGDPVPGYDLHCPLMRLPLVFNTSLETIPSDTPYLQPDEASLAKWSRKLGSTRRLRVGLVWCGSPAHTNDRNRSLPLQLLSPLFDLPADWICLQKDIRDTDRAELAGLRAVRAFEQDIVDFSDTAALTQLCDLVISVDTAVAHLAGALAKPLWLLLPFSADWRWLLDREDSPWYPTAKLFRQAEIGDWGNVIDRVRREIELLLAHQARVQKD